MSLTKPDNASSETNEFVGHNAKNVAPPNGPSDDFVGSQYQPDSRAGADSPKGIFVPRWVMKITNSKAEVLVVNQLISSFQAVLGRLHEHLDRDFLIDVLESFDRRERLNVASRRINDHRPDRHDSQCNCSSHRFHLQRRGLFGEDQPDQPGAF